MGSPGAHFGSKLGSTKGLSKIFIFSVFSLNRDVRNSYIAVVKKLLDRFPFNNAVLKSVGILNPNKRLQYGDRAGKFKGVNLFGLVLQFSSFSILEFFQCFISVALFCCLFQSLLQFTKVAEYTVAFVFTVTFQCCSCWTDSSKTCLTKRSMRSWMSGTLSK